MEGAFDGSAATLSSLPPQVKTLKIKRLQTRDAIVLGCVATAGWRRAGVGAREREARRGGRTTDASQQSEAMKEANQSEWNNGTDKSYSITHVKRELKTCLSRSTISLPGKMCQTREGGHLCEKSVRKQDEAA